MSDAKNNCYSYKTKDLAKILGDMLGEEKEEEKRHFTLRTGIAGMMTFNAHMELGAIVYGTDTYKQKLDRLSKAYVDKCVEAHKAKGKVKEYQSIPFIEQILKFSHWLKRTFR